MATLTPTHAAGQSRLVRQSINPVDMAITASAGTTDVLYAGPYSAIMVLVVSGSVATLSIHASATENGTYQPLFNTDGAAITVSVATTRWQAVSLQAFVAPYIKFVGDVAGVVRVTGKG